jgi:hypothetical protein
MKTTAQKFIEAQRVERELSNERLSMTRKGAR